MRDSNSARKTYRHLEKQRLLEERSKVLERLKALDSPSAINASFLHGGGYASVGGRDASAGVRGRGGDPKWTMHNDVNSRAKVDKEDVVIELPKINPQSKVAGGVTKDWMKAWQEMQMDLLRGTRSSSPSMEYEPTKEDSASAPDDHNNDQSNKLPNDSHTQKKLAVSSAEKEPTASILADIHSVRDEYLRLGGADVQVLQQIKELEMEALEVAQHQHLRGKTRQGLEDWGGIGLPITLPALELLYCTFDFSEPASEIQVLPTLPQQNEYGGLGYLKTFKLGAKKRGRYIPPTPLTRLFIQLRPPPSLAPSANYNPNKPFAWTVMDLFQIPNMLLETGLWKLKFFAPPIAFHLSTERIYAGECKVINGVELYMRLMDPVMESLQDAWDLDLGGRKEYVLYIPVGGREIPAPPVAEAAEEKVEEPLEETEEEIKMKSLRGSKDGLADAPPVVVMATPQFLME
ncbi:hypothetical protein HDV05_007615, partial [Chytridiales sp. JEL 0842]